MRLLVETEDSDALTEHIKDELPFSLWFIGGKVQVKSAQMLDDNTGLWHLPIKAEENLKRPE